MNSSFELNRNKKNDEISNAQKKIKRNTMDALRYPNNKIKNKINNNFEPNINNTNNQNDDDKIQKEQNSNEINNNKSNDIDKNIDIDNHSINSKNNNEKDEFNLIKKDNNDINISNGQNYSNENINKINDINQNNNLLNEINDSDKLKGKNNNKFNDDESNFIFNNDIQINNPINNVGTRNSKNFGSNITKKETETDKFLKIKSSNDSNNKESKERMNTEEYLENNLESDENSLNKKELNNNYTIHKNNEYSENSESKDEENEENILIKKLIPNCFISKISKSDRKINKLIPHKKRVFISRLINPHELIHNKDNTEFLSIPILSKCYMTNQYIMKNSRNLLTTKKNKYFFKTKLVLKKGENDAKLKKVLNIKKMPKVYKKSIISPHKTTLFRKKSKIGNYIKYPSVIDISNNNNNIEINIKKDKKKNERISLLSKDKDPYLNNLNNIIEKENEKNRKGNIIVKENNKTIKELNNNDINGNNIDISILFSNKEILKKTRRIKRYPSSAKKNNNKNLVEHLYKDLREINNKLDNNDYLKKNFLKIHYDKHVGDEETCPICRQVRKRGRKSEREKGLFNAFSFRNINNFNKKAFSRLKLTLQSKLKGKETELWNNAQRKNNVFENNFLSLNNNDEIDFKKKYMQFNGMNRLKRLKRYGSSENMVNSECISNNNNFRNLKLNMDKESEKNYDGLNKYQYPVLNNYFNDN